MFCLFKQTRTSSLPRPIVRLNLPHLFSSSSSLQLSSRHKKRRYYDLDSLSKCPTQPLKKEQLYNPSYHLQRQFYHKPSEVTSSVEQIQLEEPFKTKTKSEYTQQENYVGPVCPRSNLRPVWYSTNFSRAMFQSSPKNHIQHPYSLEEFNSDLIQPHQSLEILRAQFELQDLEWRFLQNRIDTFNQIFWESQSTKFEEFELKIKRQVLDDHHDHHTDSFISNQKNHQQQVQEEKLEYALDQFYKSWLIQQKQVFRNYNLEWWRFQPALIKGGWKSRIRSWRWKLACWKYTFSFENWIKRFH